MIAIKKIETGQAAPDFQLPDQNGKIHMLSGYRGQWLLLYFYPKDNTAGCTREACSIRDHFGELKALGVMVLGVSADPVESHQSFAAEYSLPFPILADPDKHTITAYGAWGKKVSSSGQEYEGPYRMSFLISPEGRIAKVYENVNPETHMDEVLSDIPKLTS